MANIRFVSQGDHLPVQAIVLVGGEGTRLRPLTYGTPKPMVPILGVPFLARTMERLAQAGIRDVILPAGYLPQQIMDYFGDGSQLGMKITYVIEEVPLGTAGALKNVEEHITGPFVVLNGDILTSLDLRAMMEAHQRKGGIGLLHLIRVADPSAFGCVVHDEEGRISAFVEKPPRGTEPTDEVNAGTYLFERETFPAIIASGQGLYAYTTDDYWMDLGKPEQYLSAHRDVLARRMPLLAVEPGITGEGAAAVRAAQASEPVHADAGVRIDPSARIGPNVVLGENCTIGAGASLRESVLWDGVVVEAGAQIDGSIIASGARIGADAVVAAGSVIGHDTEIAAGTQLEPGSRIGASAPISR
jgi:mannose-1-phosphate guanylyltransferase